MNAVAKKGDMLFVGEDEDTLAVIVLETIKYKEENYLKVVAMPIMVEKILNEDLTEAEYVREISNGEQYLLEPVQDKLVIKALKSILKANNTETKQQESKA